MPYTRYNGANLAQDTITPGITAAATTVTVDSKGALYPAHDGSTDYDYPCLLEQFDASGVCTKREMVLVTARTGNQFTIQRSFGSVPGSDTATSQGTTAYAFDEGARFSLMTAWELIKEILDGLDERVTKTEFQQASQIYAASSTGNDSYAVTLDPVPASLSAIKRVMFKADVANTGAATLNINSLGAKAIKKNGGADDLEDGDIAIDQIVLCVYDATNDVFQMASLLGVTQASSSSQEALKKTNLSRVATSPGDVLLTENMVEFADATSVQSVSAAAGETRVSFLAVGSGVSGSSIKLALRKYGSPSGSLGVRIETDNAGEPSGTLVDANATGTVSAGSLSTSLADTTVSFAGSFTVTKGTKVHIVLFQGTYGSETTSSSNYYGVGYSTQTTTTRPYQTYNGTNRGQNNVSNAHGVVFDTDQSLTTSSGFRIQATADTYIVSVTKPSANTGTRALVREDGGTIIDTATFVGDVATFTTPIAITNTTYYRVEVDNNGGSFNQRRKNSGISYPYSATKLDFVSESGNGAGTSTLYAYGPESITTSQSLSFDEFIYAFGDVIEGPLLLKTNAGDTATIPFDTIMIANQTRSALQDVECIIDGISDNHTGLDMGEDYYLTDTDGAIGTTPGTNKYKVGKAISDTSIILDQKDYRETTQSAGTSPYTYQNDKGYPILMTITGGTVSAVAISRDGSNFFQIAGATNTQVVLQPLDSVKITYSSTPTLTIFYI